MTRRAGSRLLPAMLVGLVLVFLAVAFLTTWIDTRVRPPPPSDPPLAQRPAIAQLPPAPAAAKKTPPSSLNKCISESGGAPVYTSEACPPGTRLERRIAVAAMQAETPELRRAREQCEAGKQRERIEMARLGNRRTASDLRLWGDYVARECAAYTATARPAR